MKEIRALRVFELTPRVATDSISSSLRVCRHANHGVARSLTEQTELPGRGVAGLSIDPGFHWFGCAKGCLRMWLADALRFCGKATPSTRRASVRRKRYGRVR
jgi:hypothetical protein